MMISLNPKLIALNSPANNEKNKTSSLALKIKTKIVSYCFYADEILTD